MMRRCFCGVVKTILVGVHIWIISRTHAKNGPDPWGSSWSSSIRDTNTHWDGQDFFNFFAGMGVLCNHMVFCESLAGKRT